MSATSRMLQQVHNETADVFDIIWDEVIDERATKQEVNFIASQFRKGATLLDLGCGTGRHLIPLIKKGYSVTGLDSGKKLLKVTSKKLEHHHLIAPLINADINKIRKLPQQYDGVYSFWNSFCEMAHSEQQARHILHSIFLSLKPGGKLIIDQNTNVERFSPQSLTYAAEISHGAREYTMLFLPYKYHLKKRRVISKERVIVRERGKLISNHNFTLTQQWWTKQQLERFCKQAGFTSCVSYGVDFKPHARHKDRLVIVARKES